MRKLLKNTLVVLWCIVAFGVTIPCLIGLAIFTFKHMDLRLGLERLGGFALCLLVPVVVLEIMDWRKKAKELDRIMEQRQEEHERVKRDAARAVEGLAK
jgi:hypothetical protein